jgi:hypothetical protein
MDMLLVSFVRLQPDLASVPRRPLQVDEKMVCAAQQWGVNPNSSSHVGRPIRKRDILAQTSILASNDRAPRTPPFAMSDEERRELEGILARLRQEHRDLDAAIEALHNAPGADILQVQRLKKRKLQLRDRIRMVEDQLTPDIIA